MRDLPGPGLEPVSPTLAGGFLTTAPPGTPQINQYFMSISVHDSENISTSRICGTFIKADHILGYKENFNSFPNVETV